MKKLLTPDFTKKQFEIIFTVYENCQTAEIVCHNEYTPKYAEVIGCLQIQVANMVHNQSEHNRREFKKFQALQKKKGFPTSPKQNKA